MQQYTHLFCWARNTSSIVVFVLLQACMGSDFELTAKKKHPTKSSSPASSVIEVPLDPDDRASAGLEAQPFTGRLLGGMQEPGGDVKLTAEIRQKQTALDTTHN
ncbi:MAG: hypothetical protein AAFQ08_03530, partial [Bacteroidota bacterium]